MKRQAALPSSWRKSQEHRLRGQVVEEVGLLKDELC